MNGDEIDMGMIEMWAWFEVQGFMEAGFTHSTACGAMTERLKKPRWERSVFGTTSRRYPRNGLNCSFPCRFREDGTISTRLGFMFAYSDGTTF